MNKCLKISLSILLILFLFSFYHPKIKAETNHLVINEVYYDIAKDKGAEGTNEWVELYNPTSSQINLKNWTICDSTASERVIKYDSLIEPHSFAVITKDNTTWAFWIIPVSTTKVELGYTIGSGLNNDGDKVILHDDSHNLVDQISYGKDKDILDLSPVAEGHSFERIPKGGDEFVTQSDPTPGIGLPSKITLSFGEIETESIELSWTRNLDLDFKNYLVYQSVDNIAWAEVNKINSNDILDLKISPLDSGRKYYFKIRVENQKGGFWDSNIVSAVTKKVYSSAIIVNELFPHPSTGTDNEFIELYNSSNEIVDLSGWFLKDGMGSTTTFNIPEKTLINPNSYLIFYKKDTHISLNDDGDNVSLFWPDNTQVSFSTSYKNADADMSWSRDIAGNWIFSTTSTPGEKNNITIEENVDQNQNINILSINEAKTKPKNSWVKVSGIVTVIPGLFGKRVMYIQDDSGGIKIYFDKAIWPNVKNGDRVIIFGKITLISGEYEIKVYSPSDIVIIGNEKPPNPIAKKINELENFIGQVIKVSGQVTKISGSTIWVDDGTGILRIYFYSATGIKKLGLEEGDWITIVGILSKTSSGLRLLPRSKEDIKITKQGQEETKAEKVDSVSQILGVEKALASSDYRGDSSPSDIKKNIYYLWGGIVFIFALLSLASLMIFARIREKDGNINQFF